MNGRELFEVYALEASLSSDGHRPYWDFLKGSQRDLWDRVAKRLTSENPLAGVVVYEVDGSRYNAEDIQSGTIDGAKITSGTITAEDIQQATITSTDVARARDEVAWAVGERPYPDTSLDDYPLGPGRVERFRQWWRSR